VSGVAGWRRRDGFRHDVAIVHQQHRNMVRA
jgi:hypothetical protein